MDRHAAALTDADGKKLLHAIVVLTQAMYGAAQAREWDVFMELEQQRAEVLARLAPLQAIAEQGDAEAAMHMQELLLLNHNMLKLAEQERSSIEVELRHFNETRNAQQAYIQHQ